MVMEREPHAVQKPNEKILALLELGREHAGRAHVKSQPAEKPQQHELAETRATIHKNDWRKGENKKRVSCNENAYANKDAEEPASCIAHQHL